MIFSTLAVFSSAVIAAPLPRNKKGEKHVEPITSEEYTVRDMERRVNELKCKSQLIVDRLPYEIQVFNCVKNMPVGEYSGLWSAVQACDRRVDEKNPNLKKRVEQSSSLWCSERFVIEDTLENWGKSIREKNCEREFYKVNNPMVKAIFDCVKKFPVGEYKDLPSAKSKCAKKLGFDPKKVDQRFPGCPNQ
jgi:hypothetical protein